MAVGLNLSRNVRPSAQDEPDLEAASSADELLSASSGNDDEADSDDEVEGSISQPEEESDGDVHQKLNNVSFGALKTAHDSISRKRKRNVDSSEDQEAKLAALRQRLRSIKQIPSTRQSKTNRRAATTEQAESISQSDRSDSDSRQSDAETTRTRSKHAPTEISSKRQVTRKRQVINVPKQIIRDPRFDAIRQRSDNSGNQDKAYAFLQDYQRSEIEQLKAAMKSAKSQEDKDVLRQQMLAMQNRLKAKEAKERERNIVRKHRKQEGEQVQQGKNPYYLKRSEVKQRALVEKFDSMKSKDRERLMDRRRKKVSQKEKKRMPDARRYAD